MHVQVRAGTHTSLLLECPVFIGPDIVFRILAVAERRTRLVVYVYSTICIFYFCLIHTQLVDGE